MEEYSNQVWRENKVCLWLHKLVALKREFASFPKLVKKDNGVGWDHDKKTFKLMVDGECEW